MHIADWVINWLVEKVCGAVGHPAVLEVDYHEVSDVEGKILDRDRERGETSKDIM